FSSTLASRHWLARVAGRLRRSIGSSAASQRARSTRPARPVPDSASSACRGSEDGAAPPYGLDGSDMMNVIIAANFLKAPKKLSFDQPRVVAAALGSLLLLLGLGFGIGYLSRGADGAARAELASLRATVDQQQLALDQAREDAQLEINALAARVGELQAQANRLNALGDRLTRVGKLKDGEFNFGELPGQGGAETAGDMPSRELLASLDALQAQFDHNGNQLTVLEALLFDQSLDADAVPAGMPAPGYISSGYGGRNDPFGRGRAHHMGIDIDA